MLHTHSGCWWAEPQSPEPLPRGPVSSQNEIWFYIEEHFLFPHPCSDYFQLTSHSEVSRMPQSRTLLFAIFVNDTKSTTYPKPTAMMFSCWMFCGCQVVPNVFAMLLYGCSNVLGRYIWQFLYLKSPERAATRACLPVRTLVLDQYGNAFSRMNVPAVHTLTTRDV